MANMTSFGGCAGAQPRAHAASATRDAWPMAKMNAKLGNIRPGPKGHAVVLTTGAMNPLHKGHLQMLRQASSRLEREGYSVVGGWVSPSNDLYVQPKCRSLNTMGLSAEFRLEVATRASEEAGDDFIAVGRWEASQAGRWPDFPEVSENLQTALQRNPRGPAQVFYVCGTDHADKCGLYTGLNPAGGVGVVVVPRQGERPDRERPDRLVFVAEPAEREIAALSSTKVRGALASMNLEFVADALSQSAAEFLLHPSWGDFQRFRGDFTKLGVDEPARVPVLREPTAAGLPSSRW